MPSLDVLIIPLLSGFIYVKFSHRTRFQIARDNGQALLFKSAFVGQILFFSSYTGWKILKELGVNLTPFLKFLDGNFLILVSLTTIWLLGIAIPISNLIWDDKSVKRKIIESDDDALEVLILNAATNKSTVQVILRNRKVYAGKIIDTFSRVNDEIISLNILPIASGYREEKKLKVNYTTYYGKIYAQVREERLQRNGTLKISDFAIALKYSDVVSISLWDHKWYNKFQTDGGSFHDFQ